MTKEHQAQVEQLKKKVMDTSIDFWALETLKSVDVTERKITLTDTGHQLFLEWGEAVTELVELIVAQEYSVKATGSLCPA